jgi:hypothetical protein
VKSSGVQQGFCRGAGLFAARASGLEENDESHNL